MALEKLGPYRLESLLGHGGMGTVYVGIEESTGQRVAVKALSSGFIGDRSFRERFVTEIETLKTLHHPNIVELYGYGEQDGQMFYGMELVEGRSLQEELNSGRRFGWRDVARLGVQICRALKHAHDHGVIHRDLKPANLLLTADDQIKLLDFGIAKLFGSTQLTVAGGVIGTADYMAPEQAAGRPVSARTDLYSLGAVMYCLLAGRPPFHAKTLPEVIHALRYEEPRPIRRLVPEVPLEFEQILSQLLEKDPERRIATPRQLANRLKAMDLALSLDTRADEGKRPSPLTSVDHHDGTVSPGSPPGSSQDVSEKSSSASDRPSVVDVGQPTHMSTAARPTADLTDLSQLSEDFGQEEYRLADVDNETIVSQVKPVAPSTSRGASASRPSAAQAAATQASAAPQATTQTPVPKSQTHFTTVAAERERLRRRSRNESNFQGPAWLKPLVTAAMLAIVGALVVGAWYASQPSSADQVFARLEAAADDGDPQMLVERQPDLELFEKLYSDDARIAQVRGWQKDLDSHRFQRKLERDARRVGGATYLPPVQQAFLRAARSKRTDQEEARRQFEFLLAVFGPDQDGDKTQQLCVEMARHELSRLHVAARQPDEDFGDQLVQRIQSAEESLDPPALREFQRGVVELFGDQAWASEAVQRCRRGLERDAGPASPQLGD
jgi:serine/threonine protein kinase